MDLLAVKAKQALLNILVIIFIASFLAFIAAVPCYFLWNILPTKDFFLLPFWRAWAISFLIIIVTVIVFSWRED